jgi:hypothetical protein
MEVADAVGVDEMRRRLAFAEVREEPADPIHVAALGSIGVVLRSQPVAKGVEGGQGVLLSLVDDRAAGWVLPIGPFQEVDEAIGRLSTTVRVEVPQSRASGLTTAGATAAGLRRARPIGHLRKVGPPTTFRGHDSTVSGQPFCPAGT